MKIYLICPVEGHDMSETAPIVKQLEAKGHTVHWPPRDTPQQDCTGGFVICCHNEQAIREADAVYIVWDGTSRGSLFDLGMAFVLTKPIVLCNPIEVPDKPKSFEKVLQLWARGRAYK